MARRFLILLLALLPAPALAKGGIVSAADPRAAAAGAEILRAGGSAADAAIATMLALNVVEPQSAGIGGGAFIVFHEAKTKRIVTIDGREAAPAAADMRWFFGPDGQPLPKGQAIPGGRSVGVPGTLRAMAMAHRRFGKLPWARLFQPAIRLAQGFDVSPRLNRSLTQQANLLRDNAWVHGVFYQPDGTPKPVGTRIVNADFAATLRRVAAQGADSFYVGPQAQRIAATVNGATRNPSKMTPGDLASYDAKERTPVCQTYRAYRVCGIAPPSSGVVAVLLILKQLERFDLKALGKDSPTAWHLIAESERLAYADRDMFVGDPDFVSVPVAGLLDPAYLARRSALIAPDRTMAEVRAGEPAGAPPRVRAEPQEVHGTTSLAAADRQGNVATVTTTIESPFGSGLTVDGFFLNNELTDFDLAPVKDGYLVANRVEGGKRPRSSMAPLIAYGPDGQVRVAIGAAGGSTIIAQVAKALIGTLDWGLSVQDAIALPLIYAPGKTAVLEAGTPLEAMAPALKALGETVQVAPLGLKMNGIERVNGTWAGGADPRSEGVVLGEDGKPLGAFSRVRLNPKGPQE
ncbi:gamma-glutamyltransferase [Sphingomonas jatrophae]|uniref:Glutathione hydrolase proenzyme n=1 Tax=Sphingomonas jatrophae TaxID=1166337 RepID=A0A1I6LR60_9SPHN|nr:gamma-glutamyltransferase [Sphingomonas jatrophae]SFS05732.1 gamma-glutamyltranspeptidase / glutathione hydrolase [Sphingomonas jatrophae]